MGSAFGRSDWLDNNSQTIELFNRVGGTFVTGNPTQHFFGSSRPASLRRGLPLEACRTLLRKL